MIVGWWRATLPACLLAVSLSAQVTVQLPPDGVGFGDAFELIVTSPAELAPGRFAPLRVERLALDVRDDGGVRAHYRARCYRVGAVALAGLDGAVLQVRSSLPEPPGELEWPADGYELDAALAGRATWPWFVLGAVLIVGAWCAARRRRRAGMASSATATPAPVFDALRALDALALPVGADELDRYCRELKAIVRRHFVERLAVRADVRTSEELLRVGAFAAESRDALRPCLLGCDAVLFGRVVLPADAAVKLCQAARRFVQTTATAEAVR